MGHFLSPSQWRVNASMTTTSDNPEPRSHIPAEILTRSTHVNGWEPAVYMSCMRQNFRLFHVSNLSVRNFRIFLLMYTGRRQPRGGRFSPHRSAVGRRPSAVLTVSVSMSSAAVCPTELRKPSGRAGINSDRAEINTPPLNQPGNEPGPLVSRVNQHTQRDTSALRNARGAARLLAAAAPANKPGGFT